jgi:hypothetical protein
MPVIRDLVVDIGLTIMRLKSLTASGAAAESVDRQSKLVRDTMTRSVVAASKRSGSTARLARRALKPVHTRVSGNVRRLGKR